MSQRITIEIKDKIATCLTELPVVCGNSDYVIDFKFDEEWNAHEVKTAIFVINGKSIEQVFAGTVCPIPVIQNTLITWVGVFAGTINDGTLSTSTPALIKCIPCITDGDKVPLPPPEDVYNQIIELINSGILTGPQGEKGDKGDKGDAGAIKIIPVPKSDTDNPMDALPTEDIDTSAIYIVPDDSGAENNVFKEYIYLDGKWELLGAISIQVDHSQYVKYTDYATNTNAGVVKRSDMVANRGAIGGITINTNTNHLGTMVVSRAINETIKERVPNNYIDASVMDANRCQPICPANLDFAFKDVLVNPPKDKDGNLLMPWTDEEKGDARAFLGAVSPADVQEYTDGKVAEAVSEVQEYTDGKVAEAVSEAQEYTDGKVAEAVSEAQEYTDDKVSKVIQGATDEEIVAQTEEKKVITPKNVSKAVKEGLAYPQEEWSEEDRLYARNTLGITAGGAVIESANPADIANQMSEVKSITPGNLSYAVKEGLIDPKKAWTEEEKELCCKTIGSSHRKLAYVNEDFENSLVNSAETYYFVPSKEESSAIFSIRTKMIYYTIVIKALGMTETHLVHVARVSGASTNTSVVIASKITGVRKLYYLDINVYSLEGSTVANGLKFTLTADSDISRVSFALGQIHVEMYD